MSQVKSYKTWVTKNNAMFCATYHEPLKFGSQIFRDEYWEIFLVKENDEIMMCDAGLFTGTSKASLKLIKSHTYENSKKLRERFGLI